MSRFSQQRLRALQNRCKHSSEFWAFPPCMAWWHFKLNWLTLWRHRDVNLLVLREGCKVEYINFRFSWTVCTTFLSLPSPYTQAYTHTHTQNSNFKAMKKGKFQVGTVLITNTKRKLVLESGRVEEALLFFFFEALHFVLLFEAKHLRWRQTKSLCLPTLKKTTKS